VSDDQLIFRGRRERATFVIFRIAMRVAAVAIDCQLGTPESRINPAAIQKSSEIEMADRRLKELTIGDKNAKTPNTEHTSTIRPLKFTRLLARKQFLAFAFDLLAEEKVKRRSDGGNRC
jgi:hypothetical protein